MVEEFKSMEKRKKKRELQTHLNLKWYRRAGTKQLNTRIKPLFDIQLLSADIHMAFTTWMLTTWNRGVLRNNVSTHALRN